MIKYNKKIMHLVGTTYKNELHFADDSNTINLFMDTKRVVVVDSNNETIHIMDIDFGEGDKQ